jgi:hypothetical protein
MQCMIVNNNATALKSRQHTWLSSRGIPSSRHAWLAAGARPKKQQHNHVHSRQTQLLPAPRAVSDQQQPPNSGQVPPAEGGSGSGGSHTPRPRPTAEDDPEGPSGPPPPAPWAQVAAGAGAGLAAVAAAWSLMSLLQQLDQQQRDTAGRTHAHTQALQGLK